MKERHIGIIEVIASGVCFGFLGVFGKYLYENQVKPGELLALRFITASLLGFVVLLVRTRGKVRFDWQTVLASAFLGIFGYALMSFCFFTALTGLSASLTVLILYTYPVFVAAGAWIFFSEKIPRQHLWIFPIAALGMLGLVWGEFVVERREALIFAFGSSIVYSLYILVSARSLRKVDPWASTPLVQFFAGLALASFYLRDPVRNMEVIQRNWQLIFALAFVCTLLAMTLFLAGLRKLKSWEVSILSTTEPLTGVLLAIILLGERLRLPQTLGAMAVLGVILWISRPVKTSAPATDAA